VPRSSRAALAAPERRTHLRLVPPPRLCVADVALFYGERSGGIRTYLDAKRAWTAETGTYEHHVITPGPRERHRGGRHELPSLRLATPNGYRIPLGVEALKATLTAIRPDVVLLHDPFWAPLGVTRVAHELGARVVAVHHASVELQTGAVPLPGALVRPWLRGWYHHAYRDADAVMSAVPTRRDAGRAADLPLRFGLDPAFHPRPHVARGDHVLYVGRLAREKGVHELLAAAALSAEPWELRLVGAGPSRPALEARARALGIADRVSFHPFLADRPALADAYAAARVVVMPGPHETFGLVGFEAAASGARVVCCDTAPSARVVGRLADTYRPRDVRGLARAIDRARARDADLRAAGELAARSTWPAALAAEHDALAALAGRRAAAAA